MAMDSPLSIEAEEGVAAGTRIIRLKGPMTLRNLFTFQKEVRAMDLARVVIMDLSGVPYMDSAGMGSIINYYVHCENNQSRMIAAGVSPRVMELFKLTKVDGVIPLAENVQAAEAEV